MSTAVALASLVGDTHAAASQAAVAALLKSEFGALDCLDDSGALPRLRPVPDPDDAMRIDLREALMGARRSSGALPLTLGNETVDLRTPYLHVEARVPQHGVIVPPK